MKTLSKLNLFTDDVDFDPMLSKLSEENTQNRLQTMQQFSIYNYFKQYIVTRTKAVAQFYLFSERSFSLTLTLIDQAVYYQ